MKSRRLRSITEPTQTDRVLEERRLLLKATRDDLPIENPRLAEVSEILHRIVQAKSLDVARWMAGDALVYLRNYVSFDLGTNRD